MCCLVRGHQDRFHKAVHLCRKAVIIRTHQTRKSPRLTERSGISNLHAGCHQSPNGSLDAVEISKDDMTMEDRRISSPDKDSNAATPAPVRSSHSRRTVPFYCSCLCRILLPLEPCPRSRCPAPLREDQSRQSFLTKEVILLDGVNEG